MYKISHEVINFIEETMKTWRVELIAGRSLDLGSCLGTEKAGEDRGDGDASCVSNARTDDWKSWKSKENQDNLDSNTFRSARILRRVLKI